MNVANRIAFGASAIWFALVFITMVLGGPWTVNFGQEVTLFLYLWGIPSLLFWLVCNVLSFIVTGGQRY